MSRRYYPLIFIRHHSKYREKSSNQAQKCNNSTTGSPWAKGRSSTEPKSRKGSSYFFMYIIQLNIARIAKSKTGHKFDDQKKMDVFYYLFFNAKCTKANRL
jgi:hypothetical protein